MNVCSLGTCHPHRGMPTSAGSYLPAILGLFIGLRLWPISPEAGRAVVRVSSTPGGSLRAPSAEARDRCRTATRHKTRGIEQEHAGTSRPGSDRTLPTHSTVPQAARLTADRAQARRPWKPGPNSAEVPNQWRRVTRNYTRSSEAMSVRHPSSLARLAAQISAREFLLPVGAEHSNAADILQSAVLRARPYRSHH